MKTYLNTKTGDRFPVDWTCKVVGQRLEHFVLGKGRIKEPLKDLVGEVIPDLASPNTYDQLADYARKYGVRCAKEFAETCDMMKWTVVQFALDPARPNDEFYDWFARTFLVRLNDFHECHLFVLGRFSFDIIKFEKFLAAKYGYNIEGDESIKWFLVQLIGKSAAARFETTLFPGATRTKSKPQTFVAVQPVTV